MAKDPAFLFYSQDFIVGVQTMDFEDRGKYITILAQMHQQGRMDEKTIRFLVGSVSVNLKSKFSIDESGNWYNKRLEDEIEIRKKFTESRRNNGKLGGRPKNYNKPKQNLSVNLSGTLMEDEDENESVNKDEKRKLILPFDTDSFKKQWEIWKEYKRVEHKFKYKSVISEQAALKKLANLSNADEQMAVDILSDAQANGYKGFFQIKTDNNNGQKKSNFGHIASKLADGSYYKTKN